MGVTLTLPPASGVTAPTPWSIEALVASLVVHVSVADWPDVIAIGLAVRVAVGQPLIVTVTVAVAAVVPLAPVAVNV